MNMQVHHLASAPVVKAPLSTGLLSYQELDILHALRGFCAFYVVIFHAKFLMWSGGSEYLRAIPRGSWSPLQYAAFLGDMLSSAGYEMVVFFFVLSGFFIRYAQLKKPRPIWQFYINRAVRIYPPYLVALVLGGTVLSYLAYYHPTLLTTAAGREFNAGLLAAWREMNPLTWRGIIRAFVFLPIKNHFLGYNNVYWSLWPEALFYLTVPFAFWRVRYYYTMSAVLYTLTILLSVADLGFLTFTLFLYNGYFALGAGLHDLITNRPKWLAGFRRINGLWLLLGLSFLVLALLVVSALHLRLVSGPLAALLAVLSVSAMLAGRVSRQNILVRTFHQIGVFSFSLYLYHFPLLILSYAGLVSITGSLVNYARYYWLAVPLVTLVSYLLYYVTERPAIRFFRGT